MGVEVKGGGSVSEAEVRPAWQAALVDQLLTTFAAEDYQPPLLPGAALQLLDLARDPDVPMSQIIALLDPLLLSASR